MLVGQALVFFSLDSNSYRGSYFSWGGVAWTAGWILLWSFLLLQELLHPQGCFSQRREEVYINKEHSGRGGDLVRKTREVDKRWFFDDNMLGFSCPTWTSPNCGWFIHPFRRLRMETFRVGFENLETLGRLMVSHWSNILSGRPTQNKAIKPNMPDSKEIQAFRGW